MASTISNNNNPMTREYCLRWNNHLPNLATFLDAAYTSSSFVDVTLVSGEGKRVSAHKLVLSACSPYFQMVFENNPCKHPVVILKDVQFVDLEAIVKFIYNGEVNISQDRINTILETANSLQVKGLADVPADELKRVSSAVRSGGGAGDSSSSSLIRSRHHGAAPLTSSASWDASDAINDIPRKKLKKSASAAANYGTAGSPTNNTSNGDHSISVDSGVGTSVNRSMDESSVADEASSTLLQKRMSMSAPPPLLPKSKSLDIHRDTEGAPAMTSSSESKRQSSYDETSVNFERGYDLEVSSYEIEMDEDGNEEIQEVERDDEGDSEYLEDEMFDDDDCEAYDFGFGFINGNSIPNNSSTGGTMGDDEARSSSETGERSRGRRGRPLIRQPRIKRLDNEPISGGSGGGHGPEFYDDERECMGGDSDSGGEEAPHSDSKSGSAAAKIQTTHHYPTTIHQSNVPIVRVSQCSPTPPSSPQRDHSPPNHSDDQKPVIVSAISMSPSVVVSAPLSQSATMVITPTSTAPTAALLRVPSTESPPHQHQHSLSPSANHLQLVKQISQPSLPSESFIITTGDISSHHNPVIRRQNSSPATAQQSRIVEPMKQDTVFHIIQSTRSLSEERPLSNTFIIDLGPPKDVPEGLLRRELKKEGSGEGQSSFSREDSTSDVGSSSSSFDDGFPVNRAGHCPALRPGPALGCNFCWNSVDNCGRILRRKTKYHCPECHINLCIVPCFQEYHEKADKKKKARSKLGLPKPSSM